MQQRRKRIVILSTILAVTLIIIILASTLFNLKTVRVEFKNVRYATSQISESTIIDAGKFKFGSNLLFTSVDEYEQRIEKTFGYFSVLKIERVFPSTISLHLVERAPCVLVKDGELVYVLDKHLKVLKTAPESALIMDNYENKCPYLEIEGLNISNYEMGDFIENETLKQQLTNIYDSIWSQDRHIYSFEKITISLDEETSEVKVQIKCRESYGSGVITILGNNGFEDKCVNAFIALVNILKSSNSNFEYINVSTGGQVSQK